MNTMTEANAGLKRCPMMLAQAQIGCCRGSGCMAWRWNHGNAYELVPGTTNEFTVHIAAGEYSTTHGYCGLAGKP